MRRKLPMLGAILAILGLVAVLAPAKAEKVLVSATPSLASSAMFLADDQGFFKNEDLDIEFLFFDAAQPVAVAVASGNAGFGITGLGAGFYNMAGKQTIKIIAGGGREAPGFSTGAYVVSNEAYEKGLRKLDNLRGKVFGLTQVGSPYHYALAMLADKYGFPLSDVQMVPLQSFANVLSAIKGGRVDAGLLNSFVAMPAEQRGDGKIIGWVGDVTPWQVSAVLTSSNMLARRPELVTRFVRAYRKGAELFFDTFLAKGEVTAEGKARANQLLEVLAKYSKLNVKQVRDSLNFIDREGRIDVADIQNQIRIWKRLGLIGGDIEAEAILDLSFVSNLK